MKSDSNTSQSGNGGGGGMSRAAKKREKKKNKNKINNKRNGQPPPSKGEEREIQNKKKLKLQKEEEDDEEEKKFETTATGLSKNVKDWGSDDGEELMENKEDFGGRGGGDGSQEGDIPLPLPSDLSLVDILLMGEGAKSSNSEEKDIFENLPAKERAKFLFQAILDPIPLNQFYGEYFEKKPLLVKANENRKRFQGLLSLQGIKEMTKTNTLQYGIDLNQTRYQKDPETGIKRRMTLDKSNDDVNSKELWKNYKKGCTIRLLCPHKQSDTVQALLSTLELELQCMVGSNAYLTPPNGSQGFAPHYDDIEAFCLQLEGKKRWKVYPPKDIKLPRVSSEDYTPEDLDGIDPVIDTVLEEGDLLYMPRGWIHQAVTTKKDAEEHSLHLTVSAMQQWAWIDLLETIMPDALEATAMSETSTSLRQGLPRGFMDYMGLMYEEPSEEKMMSESLKKVAAESGDESRKYRKMLQDNFRAEAKKRINKVAKTANEMIDAACDQMAKRFMSERQPPSLTPTELATTARSKSEDGEADDGDSANETSILPNTLCRLVRPGIARLVIEEDKAIVYHCADNSREFQGNPLSPMEYEMDDGPAIEQLLTTVEPHWIFVNDLYHDTIEDKVAIAQSLFDEGIIAIRQVDQD